MNEHADAIKRDLMKVQDLISQLEIRLRRVEEHFDIDTAAQSQRDHAEPVSSESAPAVEQKSPFGMSLELRIGEYWLAHIGTIALVIGMAFLISYPFQSIPAVLTSAIGYLSVVGVFGLSHYWRKTYPYLAKILFVGSLILLYFATLRLYFFSDHPVVPSKSIGLVLLVAVLCVGLYLAVQRRSELSAMMMLFLAYTTCLVSDTTHFALALLVVSSTAAAVLLIRHDWGKAAVMSMILAYCVHSLWLFNNPVLGNTFGIISEHHYSLIYLFLYGSVFAIANFFRDTSAYDEYFELLYTLFNCIGFFIVISVLGVAHYREQISVIYLLGSVLFLVLATVYWIRQRSRFTTSILASFGYMALSIAIFAQFKAPDFFLWLSWQSLLVVSTAIWFRSRIIIVVNFLIYLAIFSAYLIQGPTQDLVNLSYAMVALVSARILNWQRENLELQTDMIRNAYLVSAFAIVLIGLHNLVPGTYVSLAWLGAVLFYFAMSLGLRNIKYRWLAIFTLFATIIRVFYVDMAKMDASLRIFLFVGIGVVSLTVSLYYAKIRKRLSQP
jgi:drug/metabolite transporter (DMT)-like permease